MSLQDFSHYVVITAERNCVSSRGWVIKILFYPFSSSFPIETIRWQDFTPDLKIYLKSN